MTSRDSEGSTSVRQYCRLS